jgi:glycerol uptake facilitator-like aquaporin
MGNSPEKEDLKVVPLMKCVVAELLGTMFLVIIGCGAAMQWKMETENGNVKFDTTQVSGDWWLYCPTCPAVCFQVSLAFGLAVMAIASFTGHVSGGNLEYASSWHAKFTTPSIPQAT